ncbi:MAG: gliding motility-associated C-terminal domain-containing protein [Saprospiraceae bacterium]|nr:gliding motility-associated C-terminal domain-containing protein [Candidatus Brachybacter algidus]
MDSQGCMDEGIIEVRIRKKDPMYLSQMLISPNHDGINDGFTVFADENIKSVKTLRIFNRWGGLVFRKK